MDHDQFMRNMYEQFTSEPAYVPVYMDEATQTAVLSPARKTGRIKIVVCNSDNLLEKHRVPAWREGAAFCYQNGPNGSKVSISLAEAEQLALAVYE